jgi:hypothetical protein
MSEENQTEQQSQTEQTTEVVKPSKQMLPLIADARGVLIGETFESQYRLARAYHASNLMPQALNSPEKILVAMQLCHELNLPPITSMGKICVINGTPSIFGDLPLTLVMKSGKMERFKELLFDKDGKEISIENKNITSDAFGAVCTVQRKGMDQIVRVFTQKDAEKAGSWGKRTWATHPKRMLQLKARGHALKDAFPDVLGGVPQAEYDYDTLPENEKSGESIIVDRPNPKTDSGRAAQLNAKYKVSPPVDIVVDKKTGEPTFEDYKGEPLK